MKKALGYIGAYGGSFAIGGASGITIVMAVNAISKKVKNKILLYPIAFMLSVGLSLCSQLTAYKWYDHFEEKGWLD